MFKPINTLNALSAQLMRDLFAIAKFLGYFIATGSHCKIHSGFHQATKSVRQSQQQTF